jgi:DNA-binding transcriptional LysR family regulator
MHLLPGLPMVGEFDSACHRQLEQGLRNAGVDLTLVFRSNDNGAIQAMVRAGVGHAVMPALAVHTEDPEVLIRRLDPGIPPRTVALAWRANRTLSPAAEAFVEIARRIGREMAERQVLLDEVV